MLKILNYQENENYNHIMMPFASGNNYINWKTGLHKFCQEYGERGTLKHCWWAWKPIQPLEKSVRSYVRKLREIYDMIQLFHFWDVLKGL